jgi:hypothetical protein
MPMISALILKSIAKQCVPKDGGGHMVRDVRSHSKLNNRTLSYSRPKP